MKKYTLILAVFILSFTLLGLSNSTFAQSIQTTQVTLSDVDPDGDVSSCVSLVNNLRYRSRDATTNGEVSTLQDFLQSKGYLNSEPTGYFGLLTQKAVVAFQKENKINPTGYVGPITRAKIKEMTCGGTDPIGSVVISGVSGPQTLKVNEQGTWTVKASSTTGGNLSYSVNWGDEVMLTTQGVNEPNRPAPQQSATFTHTYSKAGIYKPTFTVTSANTINCITTPCPSNGGSATTSISVNVGDVTSSSLTILTPAKNATYNTYLPYLTWTNSIPYSSNTNYLVVLTSVSVPGQKWTVNLTSDQASCSASDVCKYKLPDLYLGILSQTGTYTVVVTNLQNNAYDSATFKVMFDSSSGYLYINPESASVKVGGTTTLQAMYQPPMPPCPDGLACKMAMPAPYPVSATWKSSNTGVATVAYKDTCPPGALCGAISTIDYKTATITGVSKGDAAITANYNGKAISFTATAKVTVGFNLPPGCTVSTGYSSTTGESCGCNGTPYSSYNGEPCPTTSSITVLSPNGGETWIKGKTYTISWKSNNVSKFDILLDQRMGDVPGDSIIKLGVTGDSYQWTVPSNFTSIDQDFYSGQYKIQVCDNSKEDKAYPLYPTPSYLHGCEAQSANWFSVAASSTQPSIKVISPNGGETYGIGKEMTVKWTSTGGDKVAIYMAYPNGGVCYITSVPSSNTDYTFTPHGYKCPQIPQTISAGQYKINLYLHKDGVDNDSGIAHDSSDNYFTISGVAYMQGDVNADGAIDCTDLTMIANGAAGIITLTADQIKRADMSGNGTVSAYDAALLAKKYSLNCTNTTNAGTLSIDPSSVSLKVGGTTTLQAMYQPPLPACLSAVPACEIATPAPYPVTATSWTVSNNNLSNTPVASITYSSDRSSAILTGLSAGTATVSAKYKDSTGAILNANAIVTVSDSTTTKFTASASATYNGVTVTAKNGSTTPTSDSTLSVPINTQVSIDWSASVTAGTTCHVFYKKPDGSSGNGLYFASGATGSQKTGVGYLPTLNMAGLWHFLPQCSNSSTTPTTATATVGVNVSEDITPCLSCIPAMCDYAAPPTGCTYVPGPSYNPTTQCGLVLKCDGTTNSADVLGVQDFNFTQLLKIGSVGNEVKELQKFLNGAGYDAGVADGNFGPKTESAVMKFQTANGLKADGVVGSAVRAILNK